MVDRRFGVSTVRVCIDMGSLNPSRKREEEIDGVKEYGDR